METIKKYGAVGEGKRDELSALQTAIDKEEELYFPKGTYVVSDTIKVPSDRKLVFEKGAVVLLKAATKRKRGDFLLTNKNTETGDKNITIIGATFDGNNGYKNHKRPNNIFQKDGYSGILINFRNVKNLTLKDLVLQNPVAYYTRFCQVDGFLIEDIVLKSKKEMPNQDGIHFAGEVRNGVVRNITADSYGQTNDDLLAINADDYPGRIEEFDTVCGPIENILFENIFAESCHDGVRLLSFISVIRNLTFRNLKIGFRKCAVECDAARGCRAELFNEKDYPKGVGRLENIKFEACTFFHSIDLPFHWKGYRGDMPHPFILWGSLSDNVTFFDCKFVPAPPKNLDILSDFVNRIKRKAYKESEFSAFLIKNVTNQVVIHGDNKYELIKKEDSKKLSDISDLKILLKD